MLKVYSGKKVDLRKIKKRLVPTFKKSVLGAIITLSTYSGSVEAKEFEYENINEIEITTELENEFVPIDPYVFSLDQNLIEINEDYQVKKENLLKYNGPLNINLEYFWLHDDYSCLEYLKNVSEINVVDAMFAYDTEAIYYKIDMLNNLPKIDSVNLNFYQITENFSQRIYDFVDYLSTRCKTNINFELYDNMDLDLYNQVFLKIKKNENVEITLNVNISSEKMLTELHKIKNYDNLNIRFTMDHFNLNNNSFDFLYECNCNNVSIEMNDYNIKYDITNLDKYNIKNLNLKFSLSWAFEFDFKKLLEMKTLKSITIDAFFDGISYTVPIQFPNELFEQLNLKNVEIEIRNSDLSKIGEANNQLDKMVNKLNVTENSTDIEKMNAILAYILENYQYDEVISNAIYNGEPYDYLIIEKYKEGFLDASLKSEDIICGNYAALFEALAYRLGLKTMIVESKDHAWNLIKLEDEYYYVDACWLDSQNDLHIVELLKNNNQQELEWEMWYKYKIEDALNYGIDSSHEIKYIPNIDIDINENILDNEEYIDELLLSTIDVTNTSAKVIHNNKEYLIPVEVLIGILLGIGAAKNVTKYIKKNNNRGR